MNLIQHYINGKIVSGDSSKKGASRGWAAGGNFEFLLWVLRIPSATHSFWAYLEAGETAIREFWWQCGDCDFGRNSVATLSSRLLGHKRTSISRDRPRE